MKTIIKQLMNNKTNKHNNQTKKTNNTTTKLTKLSDQTH